MKKGEQVTLRDNADIIIQLGFSQREGIEEEADAWKMW